MVVRIALAGDQNDPYPSHRALLALFQPQIGAQSGRPLHPLLQEFVRCARAASKPGTIKAIPGGAG